MNTTETTVLPHQGDAATAPTGAPVAAEQTFEQFIAGERDHLTKAHADAKSTRAELDARIAAIETELRAIDAYEAAKRRKVSRRRKSGTRRTGRRAEVLAAVRQHPEGISRGDLLAAMGASGNTAEEQAISNALAALKKASKLEIKDGKYQAA